MDFQKFEQEFYKCFNAKFSFVFLKMSISIFYLPILDIFVHIVSVWTAKKYAAIRPKSYESHLPNFNHDPFMVDGDSNGLRIHPLLMSFYFK